MLNDLQKKHIAGIANDIREYRDDLGRKIDIEIIAKAIMDESKKYTTNEKVENFIKTTEELSQAIYDLIDNHECLLFNSGGRVWLDEYMIDLNKSFFCLRQAVIKLGE
jgi:hypothetical protein